MLLYSRLFAIRKQDLSMGRTNFRESKPPHTRRLLTQMSIIQCIPAKGLIPPIPLFRQGVETETGIILPLKNLPPSNAKFEMNPAISLAVEAAL